MKNEKIKISCNYPDCDFVCFDDEDNDGYYEISEHWTDNHFSFDDEEVEEEVNK